MYCQSCGKQVVENALFCDNCGAAIEEQESTASVPDPNPELEPASSTEMRSPKFKKPIVAAAIIVGVALIGVGYFAIMQMINKVEMIPREPEEARIFFQAKEENIHQLAEAEKYIEVEKVLYNLDLSIDYAMEATGEEAYPEDVLTLCEEKGDDIADIKTLYAMEVSSVLSDAGKYKEMVRHYHPAMLLIEEKNELLDLLIPAFIEENSLNEAEGLLRERLNPFTEEAFEVVMAYKALMDEKYPNRELHYKEIDAQKYDRAMAFTDGIANVAINVAPEGADKKYKWGIIDDKGKVIVEPQYDIIGMYMEDLAAVQKNGKWGFIDKSGDVVIQLEYDDMKDTQDAIFYAYAKRDPEKIARGFYEGFVALKKNGKWGFIDTRGRALGEGFVYEDVQYFNEGVACVQKDGHYGMINANGNYIVKPGQTQGYGVTFGVIRTIYEGLAGANWDDRRARGIVNKTGAIVSVLDEDQIDLIQDFREGLASVRKRHGNDNEKWGFVDRNGRLVIPIQYDTVTVFINGVSKVSNGEKYGLINRSGNTILPIAYDYISDFAEGYGIIKKDGKFGFVDERGSIVVVPEYDDVTKFSNGVAGVKQNGKWGMIDTNGKILLPPMFNEMKSFGNGLAPVKYGDKWGYIDLRGYFLIDPIFENANVFSEGIASVKMDGKFFYISLKDIPVNLDGQIVDDNDAAVATALVNVYAASDIRMKKPVYTTRTDESGMFKAVLPAGEYRVSAEKEGYVKAWSYESIDKDEYNFATTINLAKGSKEDDAEAIVQIGDALNGEGLSNAEVCFRKGYNNKTGRVLKDDADRTLYVSTDGDGIFRAELPVGIYTAEVEKDGYTTAYINFMCSQINTNRTRNQAMTQVLAEGETRITLEWGATPRDLDSHLVGPMNSGYEQFHLYYADKNPSDSNSNLDKDDTNGNGFETTTILRQVDGAYRFSVFDYTNQSDYNSYAMSMSGARVNVYQGDRCVASYSVPVNRLGNLWEVFEIRGDRITNLNNVTYHYDYSFYTY